MSPEDGSWTSSNRNRPELKCEMLKVIVVKYILFEATGSVMALPFPPRSASTRNLSDLSVSYLRSRAI